MESGHISLEHVYKVVVIVPSIRCKVVSLVHCSREVEATCWISCSMTGENLCKSNYTVLWQLVRDITIYREVWAVLAPKMRNLVSVQVKVAAHQCRRLCDSSGRSQPGVVNTDLSLYTTGVDTKRNSLPKQEREGKSWSTIPCA